MYLWLIRNLKYALPLLGALAALVFFGLWRLEVAETRNLEAQIDTLQDTVIDLEGDLTQCNNQKKITESKSNEYQQGLASRDRTIANLRSLRNNAKCVPVIPRTSL